MPTEREAMQRFIRECPEIAAWLREQAKSGIIQSTLAENLAEDNDPLTVLCGPNHNGITGSIQAKCGCGAAVWLAPSTQAMMKEQASRRKITLMCPACALKVVQAAQR